MRIGATGIGQDNLLIFLVPGAGFEPSREHGPGDFTSKTVTEERGPEILDRILSYSITYHWYCL